MKLPIEGTIKNCQKMDMIESNLGVLLLFGNFLQSWFIHFSFLVCSFLEMILINSKYFIKVSFSR